LAYISGVLFLAAVASARSVRALAADADVIVRGSASEAVTEGGGQSTFLITVEEVLKGTLAQAVVPVTVSGVEVASSQRRPYTGA
jgi:hypothetical protein